MANRAPNGRTGRGGGLLGGLLGALGVTGFLLLCARYLGAGSAIPLDLPTRAEPPTAQPEPSTPTAKPRRGGWLRDVVETLLMTALIFFGIRAVVQSYRVEQMSMLPNLVPAERLFVNKAAVWRLDEENPLAFLARGPSAGGDDRFLFGLPERGDVIVFRHPYAPRLDLIKRVIGLPGDVVRIADGAVYLNGRRLEEPYLAPEIVTESSSGEDASGARVGEGELFVMGDNRPSSQDSRHFGHVPVENVVGTALFAYWPVDVAGGIPGAAVFLPPLSAEYATRPR